MIDIPKLRAAMAQATPGPWLVPEPTDAMTCVYTEAMNVGLLLRDHDAALIALLRNHAVELLDLLEAHERVAQAARHAAETRTVWGEDLEDALANLDAVRVATPPRTK